jgi:hypothetical protein
MEHFLDIVDRVSGKFVSTSTGFVKSKKEWVNSTDSG